MLETLINNSLPKSKNMNLETISSENLNKELAYLLGVYLTDGSISNFSDKWGTYSNFSLKSIDRDFVEKTLSCIKKLIPECKANVYEQEARERKWPDGKISACKKQYCLNVGFTKQKDFFENQTGKKHHIPMIIWNTPLDIKKSFIAGLMDGDGFISVINRCDGVIQTNIGMGQVESGWIYEFIQLMNEMGVKTRKPEIATKNRNIPVVSVRLNLEDYISGGFFFTIERKQKRLKDLIKKRSETKRCSS